MSSDNSTPFPAIPTGFTLTFEDNFDDIGNQPGDDWTYDLGDGTNSPAGWGWGNSERQTYENDADTVHIIDLIARDSTEADTDGTNDGQNGALRIVANKTGNEITSARIKSDIGEIGSHGYYEVRAKIPAESGAWPAIWLLGDVDNGTWPDVGEIDLMEWSSALSYPLRPDIERPAFPGHRRPAAILWRHTVLQPHDTLELCRGLAYLPGMVVTG